MKTFVLTFVLAAVAVASAHAQQDDLKVILQEALFAEEAEQNLDSAAAGYQRLVKIYDQQRTYAASAIYRLAEVRRKQKRNGEAAILYQRILKEFPDADPQSRLSRENLRAMGVPVAPEKPTIPNDPDEDRELRRLMLLAENSPERVWEEVPLALNNSGDQKTSVFAKACRRGWTRVATWLLDHADQTGHQVFDNNAPFYQAAAAGQLEVCKLLLRRGGKIEDVGGVLTEVIVQRNDRLGEWLVENGVDINAIGQSHLLAPDGRTESGTDHLSGERFHRRQRATASFTPLVAAISIDSKAWIERLLERKADVNAIEKGLGISALHAACWKGNAPLVRRLLELGADPNAADGLQAAVIRPLQTSSRAWTPLHYAAGNAEIVSELLKSGADPSAADNTGITPLHCASHEGATDSIALLLEAGADPNALGSIWQSKTRSQIRSPLMLVAAAGGESALDAFEALVAGGANPLLKNSAGEDALAVCGDSGLRQQLMEAYYYPELSKLPAVTLSLPASGVSHAWIEKSPELQSPPELAIALVKWTDPIEFADPSTPYRVDQVTLRRAGGSGTHSSTPIQLSDIANYPKLEWGDIIEFHPADGNSPKTMTSPAKALALPRSIYLKIFSSLRRKITLELPGVPPRELTLRGDVWIYDTAKNEAPIGTLGRLAHLVGGTIEGTSATVRRPSGDGFETIRIGDDPIVSSDLELLDGDTVTFEAPDSDGLARRNTIQLVEPETGLRWVRHGFADTAPGREWKGDETDANKLAVNPTLLQFLTDFYMPVTAFELRYSSEILRDMPDIADWKPEGVAAALQHSGVMPWSIISHPDLSVIHIRRLKGEREELLEVPLGQWIAECGDETPDQWCREKDIDLLAGDIVELRMISDREGKPWTGFTPETARFFKKALTYEIRLKKIGSRETQHRVSWIAPRFLDTPIGLIGIVDSENKPIQMTVTAAVSTLTGQVFRWGQKQNWLRDGALVPEMEGSHGVSPRGRMGGTSKNSFGYGRHSGLDGKGLLSSLKPRSVPRAETSVISPSGSRSRRRVPMPPKSR